MGEISAHKIIEILVKSSREVHTAMLRGFSIVYKGSISISNFCFCPLERVQVNDLLADEFSKKPFYSSHTRENNFSCAVRRRYIEFLL